MLPSYQAELSCLSVPDLQHARFGLMNVEQDFLRNEGFLKSEYNPVLVAYILENVNNENDGPFSLPTAYEASAAHRSDAEYDNGILDRCPSNQVVSCEPQRFLRRIAPPKRFFRSFWRSIVRRVLERHFDVSMME